MKKDLAIAVLLVLLFLALAKSVCGQGQIEYTIEISADFSARWNVRLNGSPVDPYEFEAKIASLAEDAKSIRGREMAVEPTFIGFDPLNFIVEYRFVWWNFGRTESGHMVIDDVFQVNDFFLRLFGDGSLSLEYPPTYDAEIISPTPQARDDSLRMLNWSRTEDFSFGSPIVVLRYSEASFLEAWENFVIPIVSAVFIASTSLAGFYLFMLRKKKVEATEMPRVPPLAGVETDEEKAIRMLKSSRGSLLQSTITEQCRFSKAKTSQLLKSLENRGIIRRYRKGRGKIVVLVELDKK